MTVYLVGAGCGTPGFLSIRGREVLESADHVVYDRLLHPDLLQLCPPLCLFHAAGKREADHTLKQPEINELLVRLGSEGGTVVRLKGVTPSSSAEAARRPWHLKRPVWNGRSFPV